MIETTTQYGYAALSRLLSEYGLNYSPITLRQYVCDAGRGRRGMLPEGMVTSNGKGNKISFNPAEVREWARKQMKKITYIDNINTQFEANLNEAKKDGFLNQDYVYGLLLGAHLVLISILGEHESTLIYLDLRKIANKFLPI